MKAIIPAAGLGTRLLPITKAFPKELLPVEGKPAIHWVLEEAVDAGLREFIVVISPRKAILRDYLTPVADDHPLLDHPGLADLERLLGTVEITFVEQPNPRGLGDAILRCQDLVGENPFALLLPDNVCSREPRLIQRLLKIHRAYSKSCLALQRTDGGALCNGGIIAQSWHEPVYNIQRVLPEGAPQGQSTNLCGIGRYILEPAAFNYLEQARTTGELDEVPALDSLAREGELLGLLIADRVYHLGVSMDQGVSVVRQGVEQRRFAGLWA